MAKSKLAWWKNTFFWFAGVLFLLAMFALVRGESAVRDPGQKFETGLVWIYLGGAVIMLINGLISHQQAVQLSGEPNEDND